MKKDECVNIEFFHGDRPYKALVYRYCPTAIILPDGTVLLTTCHTQENGPRRSHDRVRFRSILDRNNHLLPLKVIRNPGNCHIPKSINYPIVCTQQQEK